MPPIVFTAILGIVLIQYEHDAFRRGAIDRNRAFMTAVDTELRGHVQALRALGRSQSLAANDLSEFVDEAKRTLEVQSDWQNIILSLPSGKVLVNTAGEADIGRQGFVDGESVERLLRTGLPVIGNISLGQITNRYGIPVRVPVVREGAIAYVLTTRIDPGIFSRLIRSQNIPSTWVSGLVDGTGHFIARVPPRPPTALASDDYRAAVKRAPEGWYRGKTVDGTDSLTAHKTSDFTNWSLGFAIPATEMYAAFYRAAWLVALGALLSIVLAFAFAYWMARRISAPIASLAMAARSIGNDTVPSKLVVDGNIREVRDLARALAEAASAIRERQKLVEREHSIMKAAGRAKDEFLAMLGHELRNPLSAISNVVILLNRHDLPPENRSGALSIITRQTEQLTHLVNDLLDVGRVVAGKIHLEREHVQLDEVINTAVSAVNATGRTDLPRISVQCTEPIFVLGDATRLGQVVTNLLSNAIVHTPESGSIDISLIRDSGSAVLRVADTGAGLKHEDVEAIFDLFYQGDKALHRKGGLGIGLTLVKRLVEMHDGSVSAASPGVGKGATFTVRLPLSSAPPPAVSGEPKAESTARALKILVVDDSEDVRNSTRALLESEGHIVQTANDGLSGLSAVRSTPFDVALVDIGMPGMDGYELARHIREIGARISLIAVTGYGQPSDVRRALEAGFDIHVAKPVDFPSLRKLLADL